MAGERAFLRRRVRIAAVVAVLAAGALITYHALEGAPSGLRPVSQPSLPRSHRPVAGIGLIRYGRDSWRAASGFGAYSYLIVSLDLARRAAREAGRSLVYFAAADVNTRWNAGVPYAEARRRGWLLRDTAGKLLVNRDFPNNYVGDVGNPAYQRAWLSHVRRVLHRNGDDGVMIDDVIADLAPLAGTEAAKYPEARRWRAAQLSFVRAVGRALRAEGYYVLVNASGYVRGDPRSDTGANTAAWWRALAPYVSGLMNEGYAEASVGGRYELRADGAAWYDHWGAWQSLMTTAQSLGKDFVGLTYGPAGDARRMSYGRASFLLDWDGAGGAYIYEPSGRGDPWDGAWTRAVGRPVATKRRVGAGWLRRYSRGVVLVNPDAAASQRFALGGSYRVPRGRIVSQVTLPPTSGIVLPAATAPAAEARNVRRTGDS